MTRGGSRREELLGDEVGTLRKDAPLRVALVYPSPYPISIASLGYQWIYRLANERPSWCCERATLESFRQKPPLRTLESGRPVADAQVIAFSVATEAEVAGVARALDLAGVEPLEETRRGDSSGPIVVAGGPLTVADGSPLAALADIVLTGEADETFPALLGLVETEGDRRQVLEAAAEISAASVPAVEPSPRRAPRQGESPVGPAFSSIVTPRSELRDMFLVEAARGCPHRCGFCVMGGSRFRPFGREAILDVVPDHARRVGLVGSAVGRHPQLRSILSELVSSGREVSLSSLRADQLDADLVSLLARGGARSLTVAADGASERLRRLVHKGISERHLVDAARLARQAGLRSLKLYAMVGLPGEGDEDVAELARLASELARLLPLSLAVSPFVPKAGSPLAEAPFEEVDVLKGRLKLLRSKLKGRAALRPTSVRAAWIEHAVARGGIAAGRAAVTVSRRGGTFAAWRQALSETG